MFDSKTASAIIIHEELLRRWRIERTTLYMWRQKAGFPAEIPVPGRKRPRLRWWLADIEAWEVANLRRGPSSMPDPHHILRTLAQPLPASAVQQGA